MKDVTSAPVRPTERVDGPTVGSLAARCHPTRTSWPRASSLHTRVDQLSTPKSCSLRIPTGCQHRNSRTSFPAALPTRRPHLCDRILLHLLLSCPVTRIFLTCSPLGHVPVLQPRPGRQGTSWCCLRSVVHAYCRGWLRVVEGRRRRKGGPAWPLDLALT